MTTRRPGRRDPLEAAIEVALQPGRFIAYRAGWDFVSSLEGIAGQLDALVRTDARRAAGLYETFLAGCYEKAEELDDSGGNFGMFVVSLYCGWIRARQAASADADETARLLLGRMATDPYGFAYTLERDAVKVMSKDGLAAFERQVKARFEAADAVEQASDGAPRRDPAYPRRRRGDILRAIYTRQRDVRAYVALCEQTQLSAQDCLAVGAMLTTRRKRDKALAWVDRGLALEQTHPHASMAGHDLVTLRRGCSRSSAGTATRSRTPGPRSARVRARSATAISCASCRRPSAQRGTRRRWTRRSALTSGRSSNSGSRPGRSSVS